MTHLIPKAERSRRKSKRLGILRSSLGIFILLLSSQCSKKEPTPSKDEASPQSKSGSPLQSLQKPLVQVSSAFLQRGVSALEVYLTDKSRILEMRAQGTRLSIQVTAPQYSITNDDEETPLPQGTHLVQVDYIEQPGKEGQPPIGKVLGPTKIAQQGEGHLKENLYRFDEINLRAMSRAFPIALLAVDPEDGKIERLVVRRYLPFSTRVRGRIFVRSPRLSGSIDVNAQGTPLKR